MSLVLLDILALSIISLYALYPHIALLAGGDRFFPASTAGLYDQDTYSRWKKYSKGHAALMLIRVVFLLGLFSALSFSGALATVISRFPPTAYSLLLIPFLLFSVFVLPWFLFDFFDIMVLRKRYGLSTPSLIHFLFSAAKSFCLTEIVIFAIVALVFLFLGGASIQINDQNTVLLPVSNPLISILPLLGMDILVLLLSLWDFIPCRSEPLIEDDLKKKIDEIARKMGFTGTVRVGYSRWDDLIRCLYFPIGNQIVVYDSTMETLSEDELCALVALHMSRGVNQDHQKRFLFELLDLILLNGSLGILWFVVNRHWAALGTAGFPVPAALALLGMLMLRVSIRLIVRQKLVRPSIFRADADTVRVGFRDGLFSLLQRLAAEDSDPSPTLIERANALAE